jgi:hypothetical protein
MEENKGNRERVRDTKNTLNSVLPIFWKLTKIISGFRIDRKYFWSSIRLFSSYIYINASTTYILARNRLSWNLPMTSNQSHLKHNVINMHKLTDTPPKLSDLNYFFTHAHHLERTCYLFT